MQDRVISLLQQGEGWTGRQESSPSPGPATSLFCPLPPLFEKKQKKELMTSDPGKLWIASLSSSSSTYPLRPVSLPQRGLHLPRFVLWEEAAA